MPIELTAEEDAFLKRVSGYCEEGLSQPQMAEREGISVAGFRDRLLRCRLEIVSHTSRELVQVRTGERFAEMVARGEFVVEAKEPVVA